MARTKFQKKLRIAQLDGQWLRMLKDLNCLNLTQNVKRTTNDNLHILLMSIVVPGSLEVKV